jgi:hypothetical protein
MKRWVAYERQSGRSARPLFLIEAETEKEALCLASDAALRAEEHLAGMGNWNGPFVHVRPADEAPPADVAFTERRIAASN